MRIVYDGRIIKLKELRMVRRKQKDRKTKEVQDWFSREVEYEGKPYTIDYEQAAAVVDDSLNTIVVARAGSGKTRTIVAKIVYLIAKCGLRPDEIMVFVFNANAAAEINARLAKMMVGGKPVVGEERIASTFHAFSRKVVYKICGGEEKCGKVLANEKERFVLLIIKDMMQDEAMAEKIRLFIRGDEAMAIDNQPITEQELVTLSKMMTLFVNRAQQKFLGGEMTFNEHVREYLSMNEATERERGFIEIGAECYKRYHWYLLNESRRAKLCGKFGANELMEYGTDFNLIVSWASKLILAGKEEVREFIGNKKYIMIDEYQDFSQLFLSAVEAIRDIVPSSHLFVVGDDWQAINRFAGSEVEYFKEFEKFFPDGNRKLEISTNYRCDYEVVDTARKFMKKAMREEGSFRAFSKSAGEVFWVNPRKMNFSYAYMDYDRRVSNEDKAYKEAAWRLRKRTPDKKMVRYLKTVVKVIADCRDYEEVLILHRNNEMNIGGALLEDFGESLKWCLMKLGVMEETEYDAKVKMMTMHKSKGLEAEVVIILEADEGVIPKIHPDTRLYGVFGETEEVALDDQKRLFYVAMTRAKKRLYIIHNESEGEKRSGFLKFLGGGVTEWLAD